MQTPEYFHCVDDSSFRDHVYEPEADSFLLLDALDLEADKLRTLQPYRCVEIGCGSGIAITHLCTLLCKEELLQSYDEDISNSVNGSSSSSNCSDIISTKYKTNVEQKENERNCIWHESHTASNTAVTETETDCKKELIVKGNVHFYAIDINPKALEATSLTWQRTLQKYKRQEIKTFTHNSCVEDDECGNNDVRDTRSEVTNEKCTAELTSKYNNMKCGKVSNPTLHLVLGDLFTPFSYESRSCADAENAKANELMSYELLNKNNKCIGKEDENEESWKYEFDVILFNPPYVPTSMEELQIAVGTSWKCSEIIENRENNNNNNNSDNMITAAWCGGPRGRVVIDRFIAMLPRFLSKRGVCYLVVIKENEIDDLIQLIERTFFQEQMKTHEKKENEIYGEGIIDIDHSSQNNHNNDNNSNNNKNNKKEDECFADDAPVVRVELVTSRYTGEHLSIYRIAYSDNNLFCEENK